MISIRPAVEADIETLCSLDLIAHQENERRELIRCEVASGNCFVAVVNETVIGYGVLNYTFYNNGCIEMIYIDSEHRRCGARAALLKHMESLCKHRSCSLQQTFLICRSTQQEGSWESR